MTDTRLNDLHQDTTALTVDLLDRAEQEATNTGQPFNREVATIMLQGHISRAGRAAEMSALDQEFDNAYGRNDEIRALSENQSALAAVNGAVAQEIARQASGLTTATAPHSGETRAAEENIRR